jgi:hypothetical protein
MHVTAIQSNQPAVAPSPSLSRIAPATATAAALPPASSNLSEAARPAFQALQSSASVPPSSNPGFVLPANGDFLRLFSAVSAIAAERVYPAPIFSFSA